VRWGSKSWDSYKERRTKYGYWSWVAMNWAETGEENQMRSEPYRANPDRYVFEENHLAGPKFSIEDFEQFLTENQYLVVVMKFKYQLTLSDIARRMRKCRSTIQEVYNAALTKIRKRLEILADDPEIP